MALPSSHNRLLHADLTVQMPYLVLAHARYKRQQCGDTTDGKEGQWQGTEAWPALWLSPSMTLATP